MLGDIRAIALFSPIMKKLLLTTVVLISAQLLRAQSADRVFKPFKFDISAGAAIPQGGGSKSGGLFALEPKYAIQDQFWLGLRIESAIMLRVYGNGDGTYSSGNVSGAGSYVLTGDYYFNTNNTRPFIGAGGGLYSLASATVVYNGYTSDIASSSKFGGMIRAGFESRHFRLGVEYNIIGNSTVQTIDGTGNPYIVTASNSYLGIKLGVCIGGGRLD